MPARRSAAAAMLAVTLACASGPSAVADEALYKVAAGPYAVETAAGLKLVDPSRERKIDLRVTYPKAEGKLPLIVFSHGAWGTNYNYHPLVQHWASHGYVVVQPNHLDAVAEGVRFGDQKVFSPLYSESRIADDKYILDRAADLGVAAIEGRIDETRIAVAGHSYGANTAMLMGGLTVFDPSGRGRRAGDPRVKAVAALSGQGRGAGLTEASYATIGLPMLVLTGSRDPGRKGEGYEWRLEPFEFAAPGDKYLLFIQNADHSFGGMTEEAPGFPKIGMRDLPKVQAHVDYVNSVTTAFFDAYLLGDGAARAYLATNAIGRLTNGAASVTAK
ncbi:MAG: dienelactone hydrolase family protein [Alphaproteobacteria bacterium]|nr:dienelactone hydrolase family protein [Alphaproteobacteria bacterium]